METYDTKGEGSGQMKDENAFLKMKLMLQHGASFDGKDNDDVPPEIENIFLHKIIALEEQLASQVPVKLFDHIGRPVYFQPASQLPDEDVTDALNELKEHFERHGLGLIAYAPSVTERELYRFATEELFEHEIVPVNLPGWRYNFIYDEFHPDPCFELSNFAKEHAIRAIFSKSPWTTNAHFVKNGFTLNMYTSLTADTLLRIINRFKESFNDIILTSVTDLNCELNDDKAKVSGLYRAKCVLEEERIPYRGNWTVSLKKCENDGWLICGIDMTGIGF